MSNEENNVPSGDDTPSEENLSIIQEFMLFLGENKKWWLIPMIVMVVLLGVLIFLGSSPAAPFIYTLF